MRTTAVADGDEWVLNGEKKFITNGNVSRYAVIAAITEKGKGYKGISSFVVDLENTPGFSWAGWKRSWGSTPPARPNWSSTTPGCPKTALLGNPGDGFKQMLTTLDGGRSGSPPRPSASAGPPWKRPWNTGEDHSGEALAAAEEAKVQGVASTPSALAATRGRPSRMHEAASAKIAEARCLVQA